MKNEDTSVRGLVSVVIPTYKRYDSLIRAVNSVIRQTYKNIELFVVNDNEPNDEFSNMINSYFEEMKDKRINLVNPLKHVNGAYARNEGIKLSTGEYIAFLDDDDIWFPHKLEKQLDEFEKLDASYGAISTKKVYFSGNRLTHVSESWKVTNHQTLEILERSLNISTCTLLVKRQCLLETGLFDPTLKRHQEIQLLAFLSTKYKIGLLDEAMTIIDSSGSINRLNYNNVKKYKDEFFVSVDKIMKKYSKRIRNKIIRNNYLEIGWVMYRDGKKMRGLWDIFKKIIYPSTMFLFLKRLFEKNRAKRRLSTLNNKDEIIKLIQGGTFKSDL